MNPDEIAAHLRLAGCPLTARQYSELLDKSINGSSRKREDKRQAVQQALTLGMITPKLY